MKAKFLFQSVLHILLVMVIVGNMLMIPSRAASAKPLVDFTGCDSQTEIPKVECDALVALYNATDGENWGDYTDWLETNTPCSWYGVYCEEGTNVTALSLSFNYLIGTISPELGALTQLQELSLGNNELHSAIPMQLGSLINLMSLELANNDLSGSIPSGLGSLASLTKLDLSGNQLSDSIPAELGNLENLTYLNLQSNQLTGHIPPELSNLANLQTLYLDDTEVNGQIPASFVDLTSLTSLTLTCGLTSTDQDVIDFIDGILGIGWDDACPVPNDDFDNATLINTMPYTDIQDTYSDTTALDDPLLPCGSQDQGMGSVWYRYTPASEEILNLSTSGSEYNTMLAVWTGSRGSLVNVGCDDDSASGLQSFLSLPISAEQTYYIEVAGYYLGDLSFYATIEEDMTSCALQTEIPALECEALVALYNSTDGVSWYDDDEWMATDTPCNWYGVLCNEGNVTNLFLWSNNLSGAIPSALGNLTKLSSLSLDENKLSGSIPSELWELTELRSLSLSNNQLSGALSSEISGLTRLSRLSLSDNQFSGPIPSELWGLTDLRELSLDNNQFSGIIPPEIGSLTNLSYLSLAGNQLSGPIPAELGSIEYLKYLYLNGNQLSGEFPATITNLLYLSDFVFDECQGLTSSDPNVIAFLNELVGHWQCIPITQYFVSNSAQDGWILESSETSGKGGAFNAAASTFPLGDDAAKKQYRGILSFYTGARIPDNAVITSVILKVKKQGIAGGGNPLAIFQGFMADIRKGPFDKAALQGADFQARAGKSYGPFKPALVSNWYSIDLTGAKAYINKSSSSAGLTQIRLRFNRDDNNNAVANILRLFSGNAPLAANRPQLIITYYEP